MASQLNDATVSQTSDTEAEPASVVLRKLIQGTRGRGRPLDWAADIAAYDRVHEQILHMADMLSAGIINQYPKQFK